MRLGRMGDILIAGFPVLLFQLAQHLFQQCARIIQVDVLVPQIQPHLIQHLRLEIGLFLSVDVLQRHPAVVVEQGFQPLAFVLIQHAFGQHRLHHVAQLGFKRGQVQLGQRLSPSQRVQSVDDLHHRAQPRAKTASFVSHACSSARCRSIFFSRLLKRFCARDSAGSEGRSRGMNLCSEEDMAKDPAMRASRCGARRHSMASNHAPCPLTPSFTGDGDRRPFHHTRRDDSPDSPVQMGVKRAQPACPKAANRRRCGDRPASARHRPAGFPGGNTRADGPSHAHRP